MVDVVAPIGSRVSAHAAQAPNEPAITCDGRTITRGELDASANRLARAYQHLGVGVGDHVTIVLPNSIESMQATLAA
jgi:bile acid-coenzyme A ligase